MRDGAIPAAEGVDAAARTVALDLAARIVGSDRVQFPAGDGRGLLGPNISMFRLRRVGGVVRPATAAQVREVIAAFDAHPGSGPLHAVSTGRNWGLGSHEPAQDDVVVLHLGGLDAVRGVDVAAGWALVEAGVTQGRLFELLAGTERMLNVTVSAAGTSIVGNLMDRGVGLRHQRTEDLLGLEVVLPDGELVHVGWWPDADRVTAPYPHGLGPSPLQLFPQSNLGVVTAAAIRLLPRPEAVRVLGFEFARDVLPDAIGELRRWVHQGMVRGVSRVYDPLAAVVHGGGHDRFLVHVCIDGASEVVDALAAAVNARAHRSGLFSEAAGGSEIVTLMERAYTGDPDLDDTLFRAKTAHSADRADADSGFLLFLPLVPFSGDAVAKADDLMLEIRNETGVRCASTVHILGPDVIDFVVAVRFDRSSENAEAAHHTLDLLYERFAADGFIPYRLDIEHADSADRLRVEPSATALLRRIRKLIDPAGTIASGRY